MYLNNKLGYLGLLGFIGLIGLSGNYYFFGFFGFFVYFKYFKVIPDELFKENVRKAATPSFFVSIFVSVLVASYGSTLKDVSTQELSQYFATGLAINFALPIFVFTVILVYLEVSEN
ncbi:DUF3796 domain-containing protein [Desulfuribacillus alkaliarsenatis]|uniref:DUF3796 domain-containing protein n=1 Tax=Desulfuribacillus alkaliarsenatis TaxID=766136 RepID=A0A1E5G2H4_9FIRM|nr:DUF3796 domain-containing protein [Desulfuribacillus alkaliarsenatis]OEF97166.1 hypothetical protein BHF68_06100 [Desulfuribacillus alkaliarsenatis]